MIPLWPTGGFVDTSFTPGEDLVADCDHGEDGFSAAGSPKAVSTRSHIQS